jgi:hypothetical protein
MLQIIIIIIIIIIETRYLITYVAINLSQVTSKLCTVAGSPHFQTLAHIQYFTHSQIGYRCKMKENENFRFTRNKLPYEKLRIFRRFLAIVSHIYW